MHCVSRRATGPSARRQGRRWHGWRKPVSDSGTPAKPASRGHRNQKVTTKKKNRYHQRIERFIDQLQERLGLEETDKDDTQALSLTDTALLSLDAMQASIARCMLAAYPPDLLIEIPIDTCAVHEFYRASEVIRVGEERTERALERFQGDCRPARPPAPRTSPRASRSATRRASPRSRPRSSGSRRPRSEPPR